MKMGAEGFVDLAIYFLCLASLCFLGGIFSNRKSNCLFIFFLKLQTWFMCALAGTLLVAAVIELINCVKTFGLV